MDRLYIAGHFIAGRQGSFKSLWPRQNGRQFPDDSVQCIFLNENIQFSIKTLLKDVPKGLIYNIPALVEMMAWRRPGDKLLSESKIASLLTHISVTRPQWFNRKANLIETTFSIVVLEGKFYIWVRMSLMVVSKRVIHNLSAFVCITAWHLTVEAKPLTEAMISLSSNEFVHYQHV